MSFLDDKTLEQSPVVANCRMNRERELTGTNSYAAELRFSPLEWIQSRIQPGARVRWLDLCCGSARALIEAACAVNLAGQSDQVEIIGLDLVNFYLPQPPEARCLTLVTHSATTWNPIGSFDLITCVHGLHYVGDKLGLISQAVSWLTGDGRFAANVDLGNFKTTEGRPAGRHVSAVFRRHGVTYESHRRLITCDGRRLLDFGLRYVGADDQAGPNATGQSAVDSYYSNDL